MKIPGWLMRVHHLVGRMVLGKRLVALDADCKLKSLERREALRIRVEALEARANSAVRDAGLVTNGDRAH